MENKIAYKVAMEMLLLKHHSLSTGYVSLWRDAEDIKYKIGETVIRQQEKYGPFACFETLEQAKDYIEKEKIQFPAILLVSIKESRDKFLYVQHSYWTGKHRFETKKGFPAGTLFADEVTVLERIEV